MRKNKLFQIKVVYMLAFALLFNAMSVAYAASATDADGNRVLLCTSKGYVWVNVDEQQTPASSFVERCQLCVLHTLNDSQDAISHDVPSFYLEVGTYTKDNFSEIVLLQNQQSYLFAYGRAPPKNTL